MKNTMIAIRIPKSSWGKAWRAMIEVAPVRLVAADPIYEVLPAHLEQLKNRGIAFQVVPRCDPTEERHRRGKTH